MNYSKFSLLPIAAVCLSLSVLVSGCNKEEHQETTAGQKLDSTLNTIEDKSTEAKNAISQSAQEMKEKAQVLENQAEQKLDDASITTQINRDLAQDSKLSALKINVDTQKGHVILKGSAPDQISLERATQIARNVPGVVSVDNQLMVKTPN